MGLSKKQQQQFPKTMTERVFKQGSDTRDFSNQLYATEVVVNNDIEEIRYYESLNHESNNTIEIKLPSGVII